MLTGPNVNLYKKLIASFPNLKLIASGGVSSMQDLTNLNNTGVDGVIVGKAIYENKVSLEELTSVIK
jgi:phosphoribosylformimino-5-aminoimidazole carboxamide ribotide isomerase